MEALRSSEQIRLLDPDMMRSVAQAGMVADKRDRVRLIATLKTKHFSFKQEANEVISAVVFIDSRGLSRVCCWDKEGRVCRTENIERRYEREKKTIFEYKFDEEGRLVQLLEKKNEMILKSDEFKYIDGRPDIEFTRIHTVGEKIVTETYEDRHEANRSRRGKY